MLRKVVEAHLVPAGHEHSEDLICDPEVVAWIDRYAERFRLEAGADAGQAGPPRGSYAQTS